MDSFYKDLKPLKSFNDTCKYEAYTDLPDSWIIITTDILGSTKAIESGKYKEVNTVGASVIVAIVNIDRSIPIPYVFGGDGATIAIPPSMEKKARSALLATAELANKEFGLDLRIGMVEALELRKKGLDVKLAKIVGKGSIPQTSILGQGWEQAEKLIKDEKTRSIYEVVKTEDIEPFADYSGFECRWKNIPSRKDHKICILVMSLGQESSANLYQDVLTSIENIYGSAEEHHPLSEDTISLNLIPSAYRIESSIRSNGSYLGKLKYKLKTFLMTAIGIYLMKKKVSTDSTNWGEYRSDLIANSDYRKFDGMLKMVLDGSKQQKDKLISYLEGRHKDGKIVYGLHTSPNALMTCLVFSYEKDHTHFIDGSHGGYALAAKQLKKQLEKQGL